MNGIKANYSQSVPEGHAVCLPSRKMVNLRTQYEVPQGTDRMVFNPKNIPDIAAAFEEKQRA